MCVCVCVFMFLSFYVCLLSHIYTSFVVCLRCYTDLTIQGVVLLPYLNAMQSPVPLLIILKVIKM